MRLPLAFRVIRSSREEVSLSDRVRPVLTVLASLALLELIVRDGYRIHLSQAVNIVLYAFEWVVVAAFLVDVVISAVNARSLPGYARSNWLDVVLLLVVVGAMLGGIRATPIAIARQAFVTFRAYARSGQFVRFIESLRRRPVQLMALSFIVLILAGTLLLSFPAATVDGRGEPPLDALFTSTSAVCVTGLVVRDTEFFFTRFGQWVIMLLIQFGGLGIMTFSASVMVLLGRKLGAVGRQAMGMVVEDSRDVDIAHTLRYILLFTLLAEGLGTVVLFLRWLADFSRPLEALFAAAFHSVSAFCNAGFSTFSDNLVRYQGDLIINLTVCGLIVFGGLGFSVVHELINRRTLRAQFRRWILRDAAVTVPPYSTHAFIVLRTTAVLILFGAAAFFFFEYDNVLGNLPLGTRLLASLFQSITPRTAGFNTVPFGTLRPVTLFIITALMFIGASPGGTGGGIKTSTLAVLYLTFRNLVAGRGNVVFRGRTIPREVVYRAAAILAGSGVLLSIIITLLLVTEAPSFLNLLFEATSAFGTVGLSTGITPGLSPAGKMAIIILMYVGRIGPLTLALTMRSRLSRVPVEYPEARVMVG